MSFPNIISYNGESFRLDSDFDSTGASACARYGNKKETIYLKIPKQRSDETSTQKQVFNAVLFPILIQNLFPTNDQGPPVKAPEGTRAGYMTINGQETFVLISPQVEEFDEVFHRIVTDFLNAQKKPNLTNELGKDCWNKKPLRQYKGRMQNTLEEAFINGYPHPSKANAEYTGETLARRLGEIYAMALIVGHKDSIQDYGLSNCGVSDNGMQSHIIDTDPSAGMTVGGMDADSAETYSNINAGYDRENGSDSYRHAGDWGPNVNPALLRQTFELIPMALAHQKSAFIEGAQKVIDAYKGNNNPSMDESAKKIKTQIVASTSIISHSNGTLSHHGGELSNEVQAKAEALLPDNLPEILDIINQRVEGVQVLLNSLKNGSSYQEVVRQYFHEKYREQALPTLDNVIAHARRFLARHESIVSELYTADKLSPLDALNKIIPILKAESEKHPENIKTIESIATAFMQRQAEIAYGIAYARIRSLLVENETFSKELKIPMNTQGNIDEILKISIDDTPGSRTMLGNIDEVLRKTKEVINIIIEENKNHTRILVNSEEIAKELETVGKVFQLFGWGTRINVFSSDPLEEITKAIKVIREHPPCFRSSSEVDRNGFFQPPVAKYEQSDHDSPKCVSTSPQHYNGF